MPITEDAYEKINEVSQVDGNPNFLLGHLALRCEMRNQIFVMYHFADGFPLI